MRGAIRPARSWRYLRRFTQAFAIFAILVAPFLGGWQRLERNDLSSWSSPHTELPTALRERLPRGDRAGAAHEQNRLLGGGVGVEYLDVPTIDPLAGVLTLTARPATLRAVLALALPVLLAMLVGRVFCGWFCPFGTLSRTLAWLLELAPWTSRYQIPKRRPLRFVALAVGLVSGLLGAHVVLYLALPHLLVQQTVYASWLLGGGGAALGLLIGLVAAGVLLGPTTYCATLCPTGAALRVLGSKKLVHLKMVDPKDCGKTCRRCSLSCWMQLDPASGDPGPDCDLCARCVPECPKTNLRVGLGKGRLKEGGAPLALFVVVCVSAMSASAAAQGRVGIQPELVLAAERVVQGVTIAVDVVDQTGVRPYADARERLYGSDVSVFLARGERAAADERGLLAHREVYQGPLTLRIVRNRRYRTVEFEAPTSPRSTPLRSIYRRRLPLQLSPGDVVVVQPIDGWLERPARFEVPTPGVDASLWNTGLFALIGFALFLGLLSLALAIRAPAPSRPRLVQRPSGGPDGPAPT